jgi:hypothetical protein
LLSAAGIFAAANFELRQQRRVRIGGRSHLAAVIRKGPSRCEQQGGDLEVIFRRLERRARNKFNIIIRSSRFSHPSRAELAWIGMITVPLPPAQQAFGAQLENVDKIPVFLVSASRDCNADRERLPPRAWHLAVLLQTQWSCQGLHDSSVLLIPQPPCASRAFISLGLLVVVNHHLDQRPPPSPHRASWLAADMSMQPLDLLI